ncbi:GNAT family N-acetyltransferase [Oceanobacillus damuensis]|uniref:GNAT family N-acetyltransferase n=1 Tax=Oceanobacillus damuensis TaxID=937928 RepID=UPI00083169BE|nr:GNAT family N-acetyltransferase [Oceanobacillus damuensis]
MQEIIGLRTIKKEDWESVKNIYIQGMETRNATFETEAPSWENWDRNHLDNGRFVACIDEKIVGWVALSPYSSRYVYRGVAELSIYIDSTFKNKGIGSLLMKSIINYGKEQRMWTLQSSIFPENRASLAMHKKFGFSEVGRREKIAQLDGVWRDVILLEKKL